MIFIEIILCSIQFFIRSKNRIIPLFQFFDLVKVLKFKTLFKFNIIINYVSLIINRIKYYYLRALCHDVGATV